MDRLRPESALAMSAHRREAIRLAKAQEAIVTDKCKRSNQAAPDYSFDELIGKGSFGRVYKGRKDSTNQVVAIKVLDVDEADFKAHGEERDAQIRDFNKEIRILRQAQESGAENLNRLIDAFPVHSQLWLVCEYCPGGSVKTLMRATNDKLAEKYLVVVARELGKALKGLHAAGIIHRDVKAANVLIHEEGRLELCDFGVAGVLETQTDKRRTFIGTLHWMPPELWSEKPDYSDEVDVWEYGCTLYECAVGRPPNSDLREPRQLQTRMRRLKQAITLPDDGPHSDKLRLLVERTLSPSVATRPTMKAVMEDDFVANTEESHPTSTLTELVQTYYKWLFSGGQRVSLFMPGGAAAAPEVHSEEIGDADDWNFGITQDFERRVSTVLEIPDFSFESAEGEETPRGPRIVSDTVPEERTSAQIANFESRVQRGAGLGNLFNESEKPYEYKIKSDFVPAREPQPRRVSDLPLRAMSEDRPSSIATAVIDLGDFDEGDYAAAVPRTDGQIQVSYATPAKDETFRLADVETLRAKRAGSKGPRESSATRTSSTEEKMPESIIFQDFATQEGSTIRDANRVPELQEAAEIKSARDPKHATMDWSFQNAMSAVDAPVPEPANSSPEEQRQVNDKARKHVTLEWSFASAMAEVDDEPDLARHPSRATPRRPNIMRTMTMPVTSDEVNEAEDMPRPMTAMSETPSESSFSSADFDPFGLDTKEVDHPGPAEIDDLGISAFDATRGNTIVAEGELPINDHDLNGAFAYPFGKPARLGQNGFPGPTNGHVPSALQTHEHSHSIESTDSATQMVVMPEPVPPTMTSLVGTASAEELETEFDRLLGDFHESLQAAYTVVQARKRRGRGRARPSSTSDWEDED